MHGALVAELPDLANFETVCSWVALASKNPRKANRKALLPGLRESG